MQGLKHLLFSLILCWAVAGFSQEQGIKVLWDRPGLVFSEMEYDFGIVKSDTVVTHVYTFKNVSSDTIKINKVGTS